MGGSYVIILLFVIKCLNLQKLFTMTATEKNKKIATVSSAFGTFGMIGGLYFAYTKKSTFWGYVGWGILGSIVASGASAAIAKLAIKEDTTVATTVVEIKK